MSIWASLFIVSWVQVRCVHSRIQVEGPAATRGRPSHGGDRRMSPTKQEPQGSAPSKSANVSLAKASHTTEPRKYTLPKKKPKQDTGPNPASLEAGRRGRLGENISEQLSNLTNTPSLPNEIGQYGKRNQA